MAISVIPQTGIEPDLINRQMNELKQQNEFKQEKLNDDPIVKTDTVEIAANVSERPAVEFEAIDEEEAVNLAQLLSIDLSKQSFGMSTQTGTDILRTFT